MDKLEYLKNTPETELLDAEFAEYHPGRDDYSKMRLPKLTMLLDAIDYLMIATTFYDEARRAAAARYVLRGLSWDKAIRKVKVDHQISESIHKMKHRRKELDQQLTEAFGFD